MLRLSAVVVRPRCVGMGLQAIRGKHRCDPANFFKLPDLRTFQSSSTTKSTLEAGEDKTGHINAGRDQGIFFFDNVFPLNFQWLLRIPYFNPDVSVPNLMKKMNAPHVAAADPVSIIKRALPPQLPIKVTEVIPRTKEGGAYVKFTHDGKMTTEELEGTLKGYLKEQPIKPWFNPFRRVRAFLVRGKPWVEDMYRFPSSRLKVEFVPPTPDANAAELSQETLFTLFRRYGKIADIQPQPTDSKILPRYAMLDFTRMRYAVMAKACVHGFTLPEAEGGGKSGTVLKLKYEQKIKAHWIRDWIFNHPRIVIPIIAALVAAFTVAVFDPIRTFFIKSHITHTFHLGDNKVWQWIVRQAKSTGDMFSFRRQRSDEVGLNAIWEDRKADIEQIQTWLMETADTFIVVQGPRGSGKKELVVDQALKDRRDKLIIDCKPIQEARGDSATIAAAAASVGYRPVFSWMNNISSLIDLAAQGTIGTKAGFSETLESQLGKIWQNAATALKRIALEGRKRDDKDAGLGDDEYLEAHPERLPVVVIDNFLHRNNESSVVYDKISEWAAELVTSNIAHVIFLTHDVSYSKSLCKALPDRVFRLIALGDTSPIVAKRFVINHLDADSEDLADAEVEGDEKRLPPSQRRQDLDELDGVIDILGGRLTDLEFLARRIKTGETPSKSVQEIIQQSSSEILKIFLLDIPSPSSSTSSTTTPLSSTRQWTPLQAWYLISQLAASPTSTLRYNETLLSDPFKDAPNGESILQSLEQSELISIFSSNGRPSTIKPGKPVYAAAFKSLTEDRVLKARLDLAILSKGIAAENKNIDKCENELKLLGALPKQPRELDGRVRWLLAKVAASQRKVEMWEKESAELKKVLQSEY